MFRVLIEDIADFHKKFGLGYEGKPRVLEPDLFPFRANFMTEEAMEWEDAQRGIGFAIGDKDEAEVTHKMADALDAVIDLLYITLGNAYMQGFTDYHLSQAWQRVHAANMSKIRGPSNRSEKFDIIKPEGWQPPKLDDLVEDHAHRIQR